MSRKGARWFTWIVSVDRDGSTREHAAGVVGECVDATVAVEQLVCHAAYLTERREVGDERLGVVDGCGDVARAARITSDDGHPGAARAELEGGASADSRAGTGDDHGDTTQGATGVGHR